MARLMTLRNAGPNGDSAEDLYNDALGMLTEATALTHKPTGITADDTTQIREILTGALDILQKQLEKVGA